MTNNMNKVLEQALENIKPSKYDIKEIKIEVDEFIKKINQQLKSQKVKAEVFIGGSFAKGTIIKKEQYDLDIFLRFHEKKENLSDITEKIIKKVDKTYKRLHGSRDYFRLKLNKNASLEIIPVLKVSKPQEADNITDLSYSHVNYIKKKIKTQKILDDIMIAKAFCHANECYGAESYIKGFSGYGLELLVYYYKGFLPLIKTIANHKKGQILIDIEKLHKQKHKIWLDLNESKLKSPIVLIDPTYKQRNTLAGLSNETFTKFREACIGFLKNPNLDWFKSKTLEIEKLKDKAKKQGNEFLLLDAKTSKEEGAIAGSKLLKFFNHLESELQSRFEIKEKGFEYEGKKSARAFFIVKKRKERIIPGPLAKDTPNVKKFKKAHKTTIIKSGKVYAKEKIKENAIDFLRNWRNQNSKKIDEMYIKDLRVFS